MMTTRCHINSAVKFWVWKFAPNQSLPAAFKILTNSQLCMVMWGGFAAEFQKQKEEIHLETCCITGNLVHVHIRAYLFF